MVEHVPPGRAGRLWLAGRLAGARRGAELLHRKRQLLRQEHERVALMRDETQRRWDGAYAEAERWGLRSAVLGGASDAAIAAGSVTESAHVEVRWSNTMGVHHADEARLAPALIEPTELAAGNAALAPAAGAYREALTAAVAHAVASDAFRRVDEELHATQRRLRGIERRRLPLLEGLLDRLELRLEEFEREERVVTRWAQLHRLKPPPATGVSDGGGPRDSASTH